MKIQLCDEDTLSDDNIATHFIELSQIMDSGGDAEGIHCNFKATLVLYIKYINCSFKFLFLL